MADSGTFRRKRNEDSEIIKPSPGALKQPDLRVKLMEKQVKEALKEFKIDYKEITLHDEPPGRLAKLSFLLKKSNDESELWILHLKPSPNLFSAERTWSADVVKESIIFKVERKTVKNER